MKVQPAAEVGEDDSADSEVVQMRRLLETGDVQLFVAVERNTFLRLLLFWIELFYCQDL